MRTFDVTAPADDDKEGLGAEELRDMKADFYDRFSLDHQFSGTINTGDPLCDGFHNKVTMKATTKPTNMAGAGILYTKLVSSNVELFYENNLGDDIQITSVDSLATRLSFGSAVFANNASGTAPVVFGTEAFDVMSEYATGTGIFTATRTGTYMIVVTCVNAATVDFRVNGSSVSTAAVGAGGQAILVTTITAAQTLVINANTALGANSILNIARLY